VRVHAGGRTVNGAGGGQLIAEGTPEEVAKVKESYTGQCLKGMF